MDSGTFQPGAGSFSAIARTVAKNTGVQLAARLISSIAQALVFIILAQSFVGHLGPLEGIREMGRYTTIFAFALFFGTFSDFGFFPALLKEFSQREDQRGQILAKVMPLRLMVAVTAALAGIGVAVALQLEAVVITGVVFLAISTLWGAVSNTIVAYFQSRLLMIYPALAEVLGRIAGLLFVGAAAIGGASLLVIVALSLVSFLVTFVVSVYLVGRHERLGWVVDIEYWRALGRRAFPVGLSSVLALASFKADMIMLAAMKETYDVGIYGVAYKVIDVLVALPSLFVGNVFPVLARALADRDQAQRVFRRSLDVLVAGGLPVVVGIFCLSPAIIRLVGGEAYQTASSVSVAGHAVTAAMVLRVLVWVVLAVFLGNLLSVIIILTGLQQRYVWVAVAALVFNVSANYLTIPRYSYLATAATTFITEVVIVGISGWYLVWKATDFRPEWTFVWKAVVASMVMGCVVWPLQGLSFGLALVSAIPLGAAVYVGVLSALGGVNWSAVWQAIAGSLESVV